MFTETRGLPPQGLREVDGALLLYRSIDFTEGETCRPAFGIVRKGDLDL